MARLQLVFPALITLAIVTIAGCYSSSNQQDPPQPGTPQAGAIDDKDPDDAKALADLSPEDRAAVKSQQVCPVSGEALGTMGTPFKATVNDRHVFLCCEGCKDDLEKDPDMYLAKLKK